VFLVGIPGLEDALEAEALRAGFDGVTRVPGGVEIAGGLAEAARANMVLRSAVRVLWRVASFRAMHLAQLDKRPEGSVADWLPGGCRCGWRPCAAPRASITTRRRGNAWRARWRRRGFPWPEAGDRREGADRG
jgi:hypothetical protein